MNNGFKVKKGLNLEPVASNVTVKGDISYNSATDKVEIFNGATDSVVTEADTATLTNKTIDTATNEIQGTADKAAQFNASTGDLEASSVTNTELGYVSGVTSGIQSQLNAIIGAAIDSLTGDVTATGPGAAAATVVSVGTSLAADIHTAELAANTATDLNTASTIVKRDASGDFAAGTITADLNGNASTVTTNANLTGDVTSVGNATTYAATVPIAKGGTGQTTATTAFDALSPSTTKGDLIVHDGTNNVRVPVGTDGQILIADSTQTSGYKFGAQSGGGAINYIGLDSSYNPTATDDRNFENSLGSWTQFHSLTNGLPTTLTGNSGTTGNITLSRTTTSGEVLDGIASAKIVKSAASAQGDGVSTDAVYLPLGYRTSGATVNLSFKVISGSLVQGDIKVYIEDIAGGIITPFNNDIIGNQGVLTALFSPNTTTTQMRIGIYFASASTSAVTIVFDDLSISPGISAMGLAGSNWISYTPTIQGFSSLSASEVSYHRVGDSIVIRGRVTTVGANASVIQIGLPTALTIGSSVASSGEITGRATRSGAPGAVLALLIKPSLNYLNVVLEDPSLGGLSPIVGNNTGAGDISFFTGPIPIAGWDANVTMAESSTFKISSYLANGTRVTGRNPDKLGEWSSYLRNGSAATFTETSGDPAILPSANGGLIAVYTGNGYGTADNANNPTRFKLFVGKNKPNVQIDAYQSVTSSVPSDPVDFRPQYVGTTDIGFVAKYDKASGIVTITRPIGSASATVHAPGMAVADGQQASGVTYWEITVSENALAVGVQAPRSEVWLTEPNGYGSTNTRIRRFTTMQKNIGTAITYTDDTAAGASFRINEDGLYSITYGDQFSSGNIFGISVDSTQLSTDIGSISSANRVTEAYTTSSDIINTVSSTLILSAGQVIRAHTQATPSGGNAGGTSFRITKVSN